MIWVMGAKTKTKTQKDEPEVVIFGEEVDTRKSDTGGVVWGFFLLFAGIVLLFNSLGIVSWDVWAQIILFWPVLIILAGVQVLFGRSSLSKFIIGILSLAVFFLIMSTVLREEFPILYQSLPSEIQNISNLFSNSKF